MALPSENRRWAGLVAVTAAVILFTVFGVFYIDQPVLTAVHALPGTFRVYTGIVSQLGRAEPYLIPALVLFLFFQFVRRNQRYANQALFFMAALTVAGVANWVCKFGLGRYRPGEWFEHGLYGFKFLGAKAAYWSMPSGHTNTVAAAVAALWLLFPRYRVAYIVLLLAVAVDRVLCQAHYPTDVVAGAYLGMVSAVFVHAGFRRRGCEL